MIEIRVMLPEGENKFKNYLQAIRVDPSTQRPNLNDEPFSNVFLPRVLIDETKSFVTKRDIAEYLNDIFTKSDIRREAVIGERGLWTWLSYIWFNQLTNNQKNILKRDEYYICTDPSNYKRYYLHLVAAPYIIYTLHGLPISMLFLYNPPWQSNDFTERVASNQFIISHRNIVKAIYLLYFDAVEGRPKRGATSAHPRGNIRRFIKVIRQFELTYDVYSMTAEQIIDLLPDEFDSWKPLDIKKLK